MADRVANVAVVGAGPAGLAAAAAAGSNGAHVVVLDENPREGGQIWRASSRAGVHPAARELAERCEEAGVSFVRGATVFDAPSPRELTWIDAQGVHTLHTDRIVLATGASERFLPFPGWTLPGVCGAGGLQALVKSGLDVTGARVVVAGSGPLLLAVAAYLKSRGARVLGLFEQAPRRAVLGFALGLWRSPAKVLQAVRLQASLGGVPRAFGAWPVRAEGSERLERVVLATASGELALETDWLACGFGLTPATGLAALLGCELQGDRVEVGELCATSVHGVLCAGEPAGVGGLDCALVEGELAGHAASGREDRARALLGRRRRERAFAARLEHAFALRPELRGLPSADTLVCRCEDVPWSAVRELEDARSGKLLARCGMGPCQGRVCGPALEFLKGWSRDTVRPPLVPVPLDALAMSGAPRTSTKDTTT